MLGSEDDVQGSENACIEIVQRNTKDKRCAECEESFRPIHTSAQRWCNVCRKKGEWFLQRFDLDKRLNSLVCNAKHRSKSKDLSFNLDLPFMLSLWDFQEGKCSVSGRVFNLDNYGDKGQVNPDAPSIDRIVPSLGYIKSNVRLVTYHTNTCLNEYGNEKLLDLCEDILKNSGRRSR